MKPKNIKLFQQFLKFRGLEVMFKGLYSSYRFPDNPEDFDQYLADVDSFMVIQEAFDFNRIKKESSYNGKFWADLNKKWLKYMKSQAEHGYYRDEILVPRRPVKNPDGTIHETNANNQPAPPIMPEPENPNEKKEDELAVKHDWSGLNLVPLASSGRKVMPQPQPLEIRVSTKSGNTVVLSNHISAPLLQFGLNTMDMQADRNTNRLVFVFGKGLLYNVNKYSTDIYAISHKNVIEYLQKYLDIEFDKDKVYYIKVNEKIWNYDHSRCAVVVNTEYTEKER